MLRLAQEFGEILRLGGEVFVQRSGDPVDFVSQLCTGGDQPPERGDIDHGSDRRRRWRCVRNRVAL